jgi:hypothetical protein
MTYAEYKTDRSYVYAIDPITAADCNTLRGPLSAGRQSREDIFSLG